MALCQRFEHQCAHYGNLKSYSQVHKSTEATKVLVPLHDLGNIQRLCRELLARMCSVIIGGRLEHPSLLGLQRRDWKLAWGE